MLIFSLFTHIKSVSIITQIEEAKLTIKTGKLSLAQKSLFDLFVCYPDKKLVVKSYIDFLIQLGDYDSVLDIKIGNNTGDENNDVGDINNVKNDVNNNTSNNNNTNSNKTVKDVLVSETLKDTVNAGRLQALNLKSMLVKYTENIEKLYSASPFSKKVIMLYITIYLKRKLTDKATDLLEKLKLYHSDDNEVKKMDALFIINRGEYQKGIEILNDLQHDKSLNIDTSVLSDFLTRLRKIRDGVYVKMDAKLKKFSDLMDDIKAEKFGESNHPSLYSTLLYDVMDEYVTLGVSLNRDVRIRSKELLEARDTEKNRYFCILSLIVANDIEKASEELSKTKFTDMNYTAALEYKIKQAKQEEQRKKEEKEREEQKKKEEQQRQYQQKQQKGKSDDPKGFYKRLGISKSATDRDIKKAYIKLIKKYNPDPFREKDPKKYDEYNKILMEVNEAKGVLSDPEKRKLYDSGLYDKNQRGFAQEDFGDVFKMFFGGGGGGGFFGGGNSGRSSGGFFGNDDGFFGGGGNQGGFYESRGRGGQRTYYYRSG